MLTRLFAFPQPSEAKWAGPCPRHARLQVEEIGLRKATSVTSAAFAVAAVTVTGIAITAAAASDQAALNLGSL